MGRRGKGRKERKIGRGDGGNGRRDKWGGEGKGEKRGRLGGERGGNGRTD